jgi:hypothetical protein
VRISLDGYNEGLHGQQLLCLWSRCVYILDIMSMDSKHCNLSLVQMLPSPCMLLLFSDKLMVSYYLNSVGATLT